MNRGGTPENLKAHRFKKGQSGNPRGRPKAPWKEWLRGQPEDDARALLARIVRDGRVKVETRVRAAQWLLEQTHGKAKETREIDAPNPVLMVPQPLVDALKKMRGEDK